MSWFCRWFLNDSIDSSLRFEKGVLLAFASMDCNNRSGMFGILYFHFAIRDVPTWIILIVMHFVHVNWPNLRMAWYLFYCDSNFIWIFFPSLLARVKCKIYSPLGKLYCVNLSGLSLRSENLLFFLFFESLKWEPWHPIDLHIGAIDFCWWTFPSSIILASMLSHCGIRQAEVGKKGI